MPRHVAIPGAMRVLRIRLNRPEKKGLAGAIQSLADAIRHARGDPACAP